MLKSFNIFIKILKVLGQNHKRLSTKSISTFIKGIVFFFRKSWWVIQSIKSQNLVFFSPLSGKKKHTRFSLNFICFLCVFVFFGSCKSTNVIHSIDLRLCFFSVTRKKKYSSFIHSIDLVPKSVKKYDTLLSLKYFNIFNKILEDFDQNPFRF